MIESDKHELINIVKGNPSKSENTRIFTDGSTRSFVDLRSAAIGFGIYQPGWQWSLHAGPQIGKDSENHIGYVISGRMIVKDPSGNKAEIEPGCAFEIPAGSDAWVIGDEPCIALDFIPKSTPSSL
jgi:mannose-6-phosphate isomerase-like protein (cupin superfamily)